MRVLHLGWEYPPRLHGGLGRHVHGLATALSEAGVEVVVVTNPHPRAPVESVVDGVRVVRVDAPPAPTEHWLSDVRVFNAAAADSGRRLVAAGGFDAVHAHDWMVAPAAARTAVAGRLPLVATIHATEQGRHQGWLPSPLSRSIAAVERSLVRRAAHVIVCSGWMRGQVLTQLGGDPDRVTVIPNATGAPVRTAKARRAGDLVAFAGRLEHEKGAHVLLDAMAELRQLNLRLVITGDGTRRDALEKQAAALGVDAVFTGFRPPDEVTALFRRAAVVVVPSLYEPFGLTALEGMACGAPLVVAATGHLADLVDDGRTGLVVPPGDARALAVAVRRVLTEPSLARALEAGARNAAAAHPTWQAVAARTAAVYRGLKPPP